MASPGRALIAHPDPLARAYLKGLAESQLQLVGAVEADSFETLLAKLRDEPLIGIAIVDPDLPGMSGEAGLRYLAAHHQGLWVAMLCSGEKQNRLEAAATYQPLRWTPRSDETMVEKPGRMLARAGHLPYAAANAGLAEPQPQPVFLDHELTSRQRDVLRLLCHGHSNREIARELGIAEGTVKVHVNAAFRVLGVHNRVSAAAMCREYFG